mgnify:CR=1 FL=1
MNFSVEYDIALSMRQENKKIFIIILFFFIFSLGISISINLPSIQGNFLFADEAIYYSMTQSLAQDGDLEYTKKDLIRYYKAFDSGPLGIFLKKGKNDKIFYAKSFAFPLFAAPFVKIFGSNGFLVFHSILLFLLLLMGYIYVCSFNKPQLSLLSVVTFLLASVSIVYFIWISPDFFNLFLAFTVLFLWLYKYRSTREPLKERKKTKIHSFLLSDWSDYLASFLAAIAVFSKPPNIVLMVPLILHSLLKKRFLKSSLMILIFLAASGIFWGTNYFATGDWNYQGGERKTFYYRYPLEKENIKFDSLGSTMTSAGYTKKHLFPPRVFIANLFYYFFGRFSGIIWYFFPAFLSLIIFSFRKKYLYQWLLLGALGAEILIYIILMPDNYAGGGGALANRYFMNIYPFFFFLPGLKKDYREIGLNWVIASLFIAQILVSPFQHSHYPATHAKKFPFKLLPVELTLINNIPTNTNPSAFRQEVGNPPDIGWIHFLDDNFIPRTDSLLERRGFWTRGPKTAEMILKTYYPIKKLAFHFLNNPRMRNEITVKVGRKKKKIILDTKQRGIVSFEPVKAFQLNKWIHLYKIKIKASKGSIPYLEFEKGKEKRHLGVFFEVEIIPESQPE